MKHIISFAVVFLLSSCIAPYIIDPGQPDVRQIEGNWYLADGWRITNLTSQPLPIASVHVAYLAADGTVIHAHDLDCLNPIEPYGEKQAHPAQVFSVTEKQTTVIKTTVVSVTVGQCP